jgi:hypothetical protein
MTRRQEIWREHERAWLRKHAIARRYERIFKADAADDETNERTENMGNFPIHKVAETIAETGTSWLTEQQLTEKIFDHAQRERRSGETPEQAFARCFSADDEQGRMCAEVAASLVRTDCADVSNALARLFANAAA